MKACKRICFKFCCALLCMAVAFVAMPHNSAIVYAETPREKLQRIEKELKAAEQKVTANKSNINKQTQLKNSYAEKAELERQKLEELAAQIQAEEEQLQIKQEEIALKIAELESTRRLYENRLVATYKKKERSSIAALLSVSDFGALLRSAKNLQRIAKADNELMDLLSRQQNELEAMREDIEAHLTELNALKAQSVETKKQYEQSILNAEMAINAAEAEKKVNEAAYADKLPELEAAEKEYAIWVSQDDQGGEFTGGEFSWPLPGYYSVSSGFGPRILWGKPNFHRGIDLPAPSGTPIYAAADGTASVIAGHYSYGNVVKLSHGGGVVSVYAHMVSFAPNIISGSAITKGQPIGYVGSTGSSSNNHLHFEVDVNGTPTNPYTYLKG